MHSHAWSYLFLFIHSFICLFLMSAEDFKIACARVFFLHESLWVTCMPGACRDQKQTLHSLKLALQMVARNQTWVLWRVLLTPEPALQPHCASDSNSNPPAYGAGLLPTKPYSPPKFQKKKKKPKIRIFTVKRASREQHGVKMMCSYPPPP